MLTVFAKKNYTHIIILTFCDTSVIGKQKRLFQNNFPVDQRIPIALFEKPAKSI